MHTKLQSGNLECDLDIDWNIILKTDFKKQNTMVRNGSNWFKTGSMAGFRGNCNKIPEFHNTLAILRYCISHSRLHQARGSKPVDITVIITQLDFGNTQPLPYIILALIIQGLLRQAIFAPIIRCLTDPLN